MSLIDKQRYLRELETRLGDFIPANDLPRILAAAGEAMSTYEVSMVTPGSGRDVDSEDLLRYFLQAKRVEGRSEKTIEHYRYVLTRLQDETKVPFAKMTIYDVRAYLAEEEKRGISASTREGYREIYAGFYGWLYREGLIQKNPLGNMTAIKLPKVVRKPYSPTDLAKLKEAARNPDSSRDLAIIHFLEATGCRVGEMCGLNRADLDLKAQCVTVFGKGSKERRVWFDEVTAMYLTAYLAEREDEDPALFLGKRGRLTPSGVRRMLSRIAAQANVETVHPHRFRRTRATSLIDAGMPIQEVASVLGHDKLDTTMGYVYIDERNLAHDFRKYA